METINDYIFNNNLNLEKLVNDYSNYISIIARNMTNNIFSNEDMEEIVSDVLFAIWKNQSKINDQLPLKPYIAGIAKNIIKNKLRNKKQENKLVFLDDENNNFDIEDSINIEETVALTDEIDLINNALSNLGKDSELIFRLFYYSGFKTKEIAERTGLSEFNINTKLHRIRKFLKKYLEERGYKYGK